jgi:hypothetical protein
MNLTATVREKIRTWLPLEDLLPDHVPSFVRSPAYLFGMATLCALVSLTISGIFLSAFGPQWWHTSTIGHFVNSVHFWSAQLFFFSITLHLWTEFCKAAWRHGRQWTWVVGSILFVAAIGTAFTGYLSQTNFDAQWVAVQGKDAMNAVGIGAYFNLMNFGQMYGFHIVILPLFIVFLTVLHLIQIRIKGVVRPFALSRKEEQAREIQWSRGSRIFNQKKESLVSNYSLSSDQAAYYQDISMKSYDLIREGLIAFVVVVLLILIFAGSMSSPDDAPLTIQRYALRNPIGFVTTATSELSRSSVVAQYGPPYNTGTGSVQYIGPVSIQKTLGVTIPVDTAQTYVLSPLKTVAQTDPSINQALQSFTRATAQTQTTWETNYAHALSQASFQSGKIIVPIGDYGTLPVLMNKLLALGSSGALDGILLSNKGFYQNDFTKPLLFLSANALPAKAQQDNLLSTQWGMMNETGNYPGQAWLWLYTFWYQVPPYNSSPDGDALVLVTMAFLTAMLVFFPFIPKLNRFPYYLGVHRLIWREHYRNLRARS